MDDLVFEGSPEERQMARWIRNLMMHEAICFSTDCPVRRSLVELVDYFKRCDLGITLESKLRALIDIAVQANPKVFVREEEGEAVCYVTSKRRCFPQAQGSSVICEPSDLAFPRPSLRRTPHQDSPALAHSGTGRVPPQPGATGTYMASGGKLEGPPPRRAWFTLTHVSLFQGWIAVTPGMRKMIDALGLRPGRVEFVTYGRYTLLALLNTREGRFEGPGLCEWFKERRLRVGDRVYVMFPEHAGQPLRLSSWQNLPGQGPSGDTAKASRGRLDLRERVYNVLHSEGQVMTVQTIVDGLVRIFGRTTRHESVRAVLLRENHVFTAWGRGHWGLREWGEDWRDRVDPQALLMRIHEDDLTFEVLKANGHWMTEPAIAREIGAKLLLPAGVILATSFLDPSDGRLVRQSRRWGLREWLPLAHPWLRALRLSAEFCQAIDKWLLSWAEQTAEELLAGSWCSTNERR